MRGPLSYRHKLEQYGFCEERQEFSILHKIPPLLLESFNPDDIASRECPDTTGWPCGREVEADVYVQYLWLTFSQD